MPADALRSQVEPVPDLRMASALPVDGHLAIDLIAGKDHHPANRVTDAIELVGLALRDLIHDVRQLPRPREAWNHSIARQAEPAEIGARVHELGAWVQIYARSGDVELEGHTTRQRLAPEQPVIPPERWTVSVRISLGPPRCVGSEVEGMSIASPGAIRATNVRRAPHGVVGCGTFQRTAAGSSSVTSKPSPSPFASSWVRYQPLQPACPAANLHPSSSSWQSAVYGRACGGSLYSMRTTAYRPSGCLSTSTVRPTVLGESPWRAADSGSRRTITCTVTQRCVRRSEPRATRYARHPAMRRCRSRLRAGGAGAIRAWRWASASRRWALGCT